LTEGRRKSISMVSISPLDRLLSQANEKDEIAMRVGCGNAEGRIVTSTGLLAINHQDWDFDFSIDDVNKIKCQDGSTPSA